MNRIEQLLAEAKATEEITALGGKQADGAKGYFQAIMHVACGNPGITDTDLRTTAYCYLEFTATSWPEQVYRSGADVAMEVVERLQSSQE